MKNAILAALLSASSVLAASPADIAGKRLPSIHELSTDGSYARARSAGCLPEPDRDLRPGEIESRIERLYDRIVNQDNSGYVEPAYPRCPVRAPPVDPPIPVPEIPPAAKQKLKGGMHVYEAYAKQKGDILELHVLYSDDNNGVFIGLYKNKNGLKPVGYLELSTAEFAMRGDNRVSVTPIDPDLTREFVAKYQTSSVDDLTIMLTDLDGNSDYVPVERR